MDRGTGSACDLPGARGRSCGAEVGPEPGNIVWAVQVSDTEWGPDVCDRRSVSVGPGTTTQLAAAVPSGIDLVVRVSRDASALGVVPTLSKDSPTGTLTTS